MKNSEHTPVGVVVMAKEPVPGHTKTRLLSVLAPDEAATLSSAMLADRCEQVSRLAGVDQAIALARHEVAAADPDALPDGFVVIEQHEGDLGAGLEAAATYFLERGQPVLLVDSDSPTLPLACLEEAVAYLQEPNPACADALVVGPARDGGYYLIGMTKLHAELFRNIPWSTSRVTELTLERARGLGIEPRVLRCWWDVDTPEDLDALEGALLHGWWPRRTATWLRRRRDRLARSISAPAVPAAEHWSAPWQRRSSRDVYATPWLRIREDEVEMPNRALTRYSVVDCGECVGVLPFIDEDTVLLVRQYRYVSDRVTWEMPTGGVHDGETPEEAARRELAEEGQVRAEGDRLEYLGSYRTSKSVMDETAHLFVATDLSPVRAEPDDTEFIRIESLPFTRALDMVVSGEITDSMTIIAVLRTALTRGLRGR